MGFIARKPLRFGDGVIEPGRPVPVEPGRDYLAMLVAGEIVEIPDGALARPPGLPDEYWDETTGVKWDKVVAALALASGADSPDPSSEPNDDIDSMKRGELFAALKALGIGVQLPKTNEELRVELKAALAARSAPTPAS